jgi:hypothetical protein
MKTSLILFVALSCFAALGAEPSNRYTLSGSLTNQGNAYIRISYRENGRLVTNSVSATNGAFTLTGPAPSHPVVAAITTGVDRNIHLGLSKQSMYIPAPPLLVVLAANTLTISGSAADIHLATVEGDEFNQSFNQLRQFERSFIVTSDRLQREFADIKITGDDDRLKELGPRMLENRRAQIAARKQFVLDHPAALASVWLLSTMEQDYEPADYKKAYENLAPSVKATELGRQVALLVEHPSARKPKPAPPKTKASQP